ncbi:hypothetical protein HPB48_011331 [Haemaphysalis longicornis]|uniref:Speckle-type POZ protein n=1 Tax=Haemaphysalis longicornis TaxID=44386 RepID=A0A9J6H3Z7_HAELO|nr:hypothetical protein HPB48_011331 [Haemaphysalis longicornis]
MNPPLFPGEHNGGKDTLSAPDGWCCTKMKITDRTYTWTIMSFSFCRQKCGDKLESAIFSSGDHEDVKWCLDVYPNGSDGSSRDYTSVFLRLVDCGNNEATAKFTVSIVNADGEVTYTSSSQTPYLFRVGTRSGWNKFVSRATLFKPTYKFLSDDSLTILCKLSVLEGEPVTVSGQNNTSTVNVPNCQLSEDYGMLFESGQLSDVVFVLDGRELRAHKPILVARCSVFASMFEHDMLENVLNKVDIKDIDHDVFSEMLRFIYTGKAPDIDKFPMDLLVAAEKYALERLKAMCEKVISSNLSEENAAEVFVFADMHSAHQLKTEAMRYICAHAAAVKKTAGWMNMISSNPTLALEVSTELISRATSPVGPLAKRMKHE